MVFLATYTNDENIVRLYRSIPDASMMSLLYVKPQETEEELAARMKLIQEQELREANNPTQKVTRTNYHDRQIEMYESMVEGQKRID